MPLQVNYSFDNALPEGFRSSNDSSSSFGPATLHITLGAESITATGAEIALWDNGTSHLIGFPAQSDGYTVNAIGVTITGQLLGLDVKGFSFSLYDTDQAMFTGKPELPSTPDFAAFGDYQVTAFYFGELGSLVAPPLAPFRLAVIPEPSAFFLAAAALGGLALRRRRSKTGLFGVLASA
jgi:MYXO-CTERM domain-containing protein